MRYRICTEVEVTNEDALLRYARERYRACWQDSLDSMVVGGESLIERALLEAILFSNENPSPDEWGVEFYTAEVTDLGGGS